MCSFLKRRWLLLSCAVMLLAFSFVDSFDIWHEYLPTATVNGFGVKDGYFGYGRDIIEDGHGGSVPIAYQFDRYFGIRSLPGFQFDIHFPAVGTLPSTMHDASGLVAEFGIYIPLWLPFSAILGWLVIRELRWREQRVKAAERSVNAQPSTLN